MSNAQNVQNVNRDTTKYIEDGLTLTKFNKINKKHIKKSKSSDIIDNYINNINAKLECRTKKKGFYGFRKLLNTTEIRECEKTTTNNTIKDMKLALNQLYIFYKNRLNNKLKKLKNNKNEELVNKIAKYIKILEDIYNECNNSNPSRPTSINNPFSINSLNNKMTYKNSKNAINIRQPQANRYNTGSRYNIGSRYNTGSRYNIGSRYNTGSNNRFKLSGVSSFSNSSNIYDDFYELNSAYINYILKKRSNSAQIIKALETINTFSEKFKKIISETPTEVCNT